ncbi:unnamed protein product [Paramecium octaurelia]|uniref:Acid phosphatase n=1 Tax=Paramecium octaurelia TaxID=43137 RepID=A0A8S1TAX0_PAROT|nr:unnamed protein product [Paramecium octaurelia]
MNIFLLFFYGAILPVQSNDTLINVQAIWRHGARDFYYCNWGCDKNNEPDGDSQILTPAGMRQQYVLGKWLRQRYIIDNHLLSPQFNENEIYIESTDYNRTIMSAYSNLQGMYPEGSELPNVTEDKLLPPNSGSKSPSIGNYALPNKIQLIPIHTKEEEQDYALAIYCKTTGSTVKQNKQTELYHTINSANQTQELFQKFNSELGLVGEQQVNDIIELAKWRDTFTCNRYNGDQLPPKLAAKTLFFMDEIALLSFSLRQFQNWEQSKLYSTPYLQQVIENFDNFINGKSKVKYRGSSSHDSTMLGIISGLNLTSAQCQADIYLKKEQSDIFCLTENIEFSSNLIIELYNNTINGLYVRILYNGEYVPVCSKQGTFCQYDKFKSILRQQFVDYEKECNLSKEIQRPVVYKIPLWVILFFVLVLLCTCGIFLLVFKLKQMKDPDVSDSTISQ